MEDVISDSRSSRESFLRVSVSKYLDFQLLVESTAQGLFFFSNCFDRYRFDIVMSQLKPHCLDYWLFSTVNSRGVFKHRRLQFGQAVRRLSACIPEAQVERGKDVIFLLQLSGFQRRYPTDVVSPLVNVM